MAVEPEEVFGLDAFALDDRLRLFTFATVDKRMEYLAGNLATELGSPGTRRRFADGTDIFA